MSTPFYHNQIVLITGASSGIGEALAYAFSKQQATVLCCARNAAELNRVKANIQGPCETFVCDVTDYKAVDAMVADILKRYGRLDVLVNNAGISQRSLASETAFEVDERIMNVNYFAGVYLTKKFLPVMMEQKRGQFIVISSVSGKFGFWQRSAYAASKHALQGFFETLQIELKAQGIRTLLVCAGGVRTKISYNALGKDGKPHGLMDDLQKKGISPEELAVKILHAAARGKHQLLIGKETILYYIKKWSPWLFFKITEKVKGR